VTRTILPINAECSADAHAQRLPRERLRSSGVTGNYQVRELGVAPEEGVLKSV